MKYLIFDAGPVISLTMNGMLHVVEKLKGEFKGEFIITPAVKREIIDRPMKIKKYKLEALQVKDLIDKGIFKMSRTIIADNKLDQETKNVLKAANGTLRTTQTGEKMKILHEGEASCMALANLCGCDNLIVVDERTTRLLTEAPQNLERLMEKKLHTPLDAHLENLKAVGQHRFIRSSELLFIAYKKDLIGVKKSKDLLDALLYGVKYKGTAISEDEIEAMKRLI